MNLYIRKKPTPQEHERSRLELAEFNRRSELGTFLVHNMKSVGLIKQSHARGMTRHAMERIWGRRLVDAVLGTG